MPDVPVFPTTALSRERAAHADDGRLTLQVCLECGATQYPSGDVCRRCLAPELGWRETRGAGRVLATAVVHASLDPAVRERGPWRICSVQLDAGPRVIAFAADAAMKSGDFVEIRDRRVDPTRCILLATRSGAPQDTGEDE